jgi:uncharacterized protein YjbJ (UPF0337 family)
LRAGQCCSTELSRLIGVFHALADHFGGFVMNWDRVEGNWKQFKGKVKEQWGKLTDDEIDRVEGKREQLEGLIQNRYGIAKDEASKQVDDWFKRM